MKMTRRIALGLSLSATMLAGAAHAQADARGDGVTTRAEVQARSAEMFARMDANKDGKLDQADRAARRAARFDRIDADKNGQISRAEFEAAGPRGRRGAEAAGDKDGQPGMHRGGHRMGGGWGGQWGRGHRGAGMMRGMADANKDGAITQAEFTAAALQRFERTDANKDGQVTREERQAAGKAMRDEMRARWQARQAPAPAN